MRLLRTYTGKYLLRLCLVACLFPLASGGRAQDTVKARSWSLNGYLKEMPGVLYTNVNETWYWQNLVHNRLNFRWQISPAFSMGAGMRNRFSFGNLDKEYPDYFTSFGYDNGVVDLSWNIVSGPHYVLNTSLDRLWVDFSKGKFQVTAGRQRVNWGLNYVWNPNDIFNSYSYLDFDYEEKPGSDAVRFQYYPENLGRAEITVKAAKDWKITAAGLYQFNRWKWDFQVLGGVMDGTDLAVGGGWSGQIAGGGFRGEATWFQPLKKFGDTTGVVTASLGYDYTFRNSLMLQFEALYNGNPNGNLTTLLSANQNTESSMSAKNPFLSDFTVFGGVNYPVLPLLNLSLAGMYNWTNKTYILIPSGTVSLTNNMELMLLAQLFQIYDTQASRAGITFIFLRYKWSF